MQQRYSADRTPDGLSKPPKRDESADSDADASISTGVIANCQRLNLRVRPEPQAKVLTVLDAFTPVTVDVGKSTEEYWKIHTAKGVEGFCVKEFVTLQP